MDYLATNKKAWDSRTAIHIDSKFYDVPGFIDGKSSLNSIELEQVGEVKGKSLLHLQCHFGLDSLSWARMGAQITGVDLSPEAIKQAATLAKKASLEAEFICDDIYHFGEANQKEFDIVFTSYGVLCWLPDLDLWAKTISKALKAGGEFYLIEFHTLNDLISGYSYFPSDSPDIEEDGTYTENCPGKKETMFTWPHSLSEVFSALLCAGISIESFREYPFSPYNCFEGLEYVQGKGYQMLFKGNQVPLVYAIKGVKT